MVDPNGMDSTSAIDDWVQLGKTVGEKLLGGGSGGDGPADISGDAPPDDIWTGQSVDPSWPDYATATEDPPVLPPGWVSVGGGEGGAGPVSQGEEGGPGSFPQEIFTYNKDSLGLGIAGLLTGAAVVGVGAGVAAPEAVAFAETGGGLITAGRLALTRAAPYLADLAA